MFDHLKILWHQGKQFIPNVQTAQVPGPFKGRPVITTVEVDERELVELCPMLAINTNPLSIDLGKCSFCGECAAQYPQKISFTKDYHLSTNRREDLIVVAGVNEPITLDSSLVRKEIKRVFGRSLKLRQVSAGGDGSCELELNATNNVQFDISRFGIDFVASPRHADGLLVTGPITENMALALEKAYDASNSRIQNAEQLRNQLNTVDTPKDREQLALRYQQEYLELQNQQLQIQNTKMLMEEKEKIENTKRSQDFTDYMTGASKIRPTYN